MLSQLQKQEIELLSIVFLTNYLLCARIETKDQKTKDQDFFWCGLTKVVKTLGVKNIRNRIFRIEPNPRDFFD